MVGGYRAQRASNAESVSMSWRHYDMVAGVLWMPFICICKACILYDSRVGSAFSAILIDQLATLPSTGADDPSVEPNSLRPEKVFAIFQTTNRYLNKYSNKISHDRLIFVMGIPILGKDGLYIEMRPWCFPYAVYFIDEYSLFSQIPSQCNIESL